MALLPQWSEEEKRAFLGQQFEAQHVYYRQQYPNAEFQIIVCDGTDAGRLYVDHRQQDIRIVDITLLPPFRGMGIGSFYLRRLIESARHAGKSLSIHVERNNRALGLYRRLGFRTVNDSHPIYVLMSWHLS